MLDTIKKQKADLEKLAPNADAEEMENHTGRTGFPDLRPIPGYKYDPSIIPPAWYGEPDPSR